MAFWHRWRTAAVRRSLAERTQCARDLALAASFLRSLDTGNNEVDVELERLAHRLDRIAGHLGSDSQAEAA